MLIVPYLVDVPGKPAVSKGKWGVKGISSGEEKWGRETGGRGGRETEGNCNQDIIYERRIKK